MYICLYWIFINGLCIRLTGRLFRIGQLCWGVHMDVHGMRRYMYLEVPRKAPHGVDSKPYHLTIMSASGNWSYEPTKFLTQWHWDIDIEFVNKRLLCEGGSVKFGIRYRGDTFTTLICRTQPMSRQHTRFNIILSARSPPYLSLDEVISYLLKTSHNVTCINICKLPCLGKNILNISCCNTLMGHNK